MIVRGRKVLYVDDDVANLTTFQYCFAERFQLVLADSGEEALRLLADEQVAVLLADQRMPGMSGAELCARARERCPEVVRMIVTAYADIKDIVAAVNGGQVSRYILKPWTEERMAEELTLGLRAYELAQLVRQSHAELLRADRQTAAAALLAQQLHELCNPLTALCGSLHLARDLANDVLATATPERPGTRAAAADLRETVGNAVVVADELAARIELFKQGETVTPDERAVADLNQAVQAAVAIVGRELRQRAQLALRLGDLPLIAAPATSLCQIVANLLTNAVEALPQESPTSGTITVTTRVQNPQVVVEIRDTGRGMSAAAVAQVFEPFVSTKTERSPRGLGLAVVRDLVQRIHGQISVTSEVDAGTCVTVALPIAR